MFIITNTAVFQMKSTYVYFKQFCRRLNWKILLKIQETAFHHQYRMYLVKYKNKFCEKVTL